MTSIAVTGYASLDYVVQLNGPPHPNQTSVITGRPAEAWPRLGGSPSYIVAALSRTGQSAVTLITWVGADAQGEQYLSFLREAGLPTDGASRALPGSTPVCILAYDPSGACYCLYEALASRGVSFDEHQLAHIDAADWVCAAAQPTAASRDVLARIKPQQRLVWAVKADADAFPQEVRRDFAARADLIVHSRNERSFVEPALAEAGPGHPGRIVVETRGPEGAQFTIAGRTTYVPTDRLAVSDPTGAGDTFLGGLIAGLIENPNDPVAAIRAGEAAARAMLITRASLFTGGT
jgi:ribokinase